MIITKEQLSKIAPNLKEPKLSTYHQELCECLAFMDLNKPHRKAMFLAQIMHESAECRYTRELASGAAYDTGKLAKALGNTPEADGDGQKYKGRGLIQVTGFYNYRDVGKYFGIDFLAKPELLEEPKWATLSAAWFWNSRKLSNIADKGTEEAFRLVTKRINGGYNGWEDRLKYWKRAKEVLGIK